MREAKQDLMLVTNRNKPDALLISMDQLVGIPNLEQVRLVLAIALFRDKLLSIAAAAKVAGISLAEMLTIVSNKGMPVVDFASEEDAAAELAYAENWLKAH